jgi:Tol biopolymer transport system component
MEQWFILLFRPTFLALTLFLVACSIRPPLRGTIALSGSRGRDDRGIYLFDLQTVELTRLTPENILAIYPMWSPDSTHLAFRCEMPDGQTGICLIDRDGNDLRSLVTEEETDFEMTIVDGPLAWSPDGEYLIFDGDAGDTPGSRLYRVNVQTGEIQTLTPPGPGPFYARAMSWSPDGDRLALQMPDYRIYLMDVEALEMEYLTQGSDPVWSPDGERLAFSGLVPLYAIAPDGTDIQVLFKDDAICVSSHGLTWSPDGRYIAFMDGCGENDPLELYVFDMESGRVHRLLKRELGDLLLLDPAWAPDS